MSKQRWKTQFTLLLLAVSIVLYVIHFFIFHEPRFIFKLMINNLAFAPISVLFVTLFINQVMEMRTRQERTQKTYLALGTFFHEVGSELIRKMSYFDTDLKGVQDRLRIEDSWDNKAFTSARQTVSTRKICIQCSREGLSDLKNYLDMHKDYIINMLSSAALREHEDLTDMLWSIYHLAMELSSRNKIETIGRKDLEHLSNDAERAYRLLCLEWLEYMKHLKEEYPYLYSYARRTSPFAPEGSSGVEIQD